MLIEIQSLDVIHLIMHHCRRTVFIGHWLQEETTVSPNPVNSVDSFVTDIDCHTKPLLISKHRCFGVGKSSMNWVLPGQF